MRASQAAPPPAKRQKKKRAGKFLCVYDEVCAAHAVPADHNEQPARIKVAIEAISELKTAEPEQVDLSANEGHQAKRKWLELAHSPAYVAQMTDKLKRGRTLVQHATFVAEEGEREQELRDTFFSKDSLRAALASAGMVCYAVDSVLAKRYARVRPPGHHAGRQGHTKNVATQGYCFFNNVAVGVLYARKKGFARCAVVDFDVHHGNGTEDILGGQKGTLFVSLHVGELYPFSGKEDGGARPKNVLNCALPDGATEAEYLRAVDERVLPALRAFNPSILFLSAGFDSHTSDPTQAMKLKTKTYGLLTDRFMSLADACNPPAAVVSVLEGGYHIPSLKASIAAHLRAML